jgi:hypothetical protein
MQAHSVISCLLPCSWRMVAVALPDYGLTGPSRGTRWRAGSSQVGSGDDVNAGRPGRAHACVHASHRVIVRLSSRLRSVAARRLRSGSARCFFLGRVAGLDAAMHPCLSACICVGWMDGFLFYTYTHRTSIDGSTIQGG